MILGFSTQINGKSTNFVEKIVVGLVKNDLISIDLASELLDKPISEIRSYQRLKITTIREDKNNRWKPSSAIDFFINVRTKKMFRFAPVLPVVSVQNIEIVYYTNREIILNDLPSKKAIIIDGKKRLNDKEIEKLALNDGFDSVDDFFNYFKGNFEGKILHWTNLIY